MRAQQSERRTAGNSGKLYLFLKIVKTNLMQLQPKDIDGKTTEKADSLVLSQHHNRLNFE